MSKLQNINLPAEYTLEAIKSKIIREFLNVIILIEMTKRESISGYDIIDFISIKFSEAISPGTVYSTLYAIERKGLIYGENDGRKTVFKLTEKGQAAMETIQNSKHVFANICKKIYET
ncbi:MAG: PadR family transcriptional regulator [Candidatus Bathyarchaeia archaeon]